MDDLQYYKHGIYYISPDLINKRSLPNIVYLDNIKLIRLLGFIYIPSEPDNLNLEQIIAINELRFAHKDNYDIYKFNVTIKTLFSLIIKELNPKRLLDYGCGFDPITNYFNYSGDFSVFDIDKGTLKILQNSNISIIDNLSLINDNKFDLIISIFVFHFNIAESEIINLFRVLSIDGVMVVNAYRTDKPYFTDLKNRLVKNSFKIIELNIPEKDDHKLLVIYKNCINYTTYTGIITALNDTFETEISDEKR